MKKHWKLLDDLEGGLFWIQMLGSGSPSLNSERGCATKLWVSDFQVDPFEWKALVVHWPLLILDSLILPSFPRFQKGYCNKTRATQASSYSLVSQLLPVFLLEILWDEVLELTLLESHSFDLASGDHEQRLKPPIIWVFFMTFLVESVNICEFLFKLKSGAFTTWYKKIQSKLPFGLLSKE